MLIRVEIGIDAPGIDALLRRTFGGDAEAQLVHSLREDGLITLGVVATWATVFKPLRKVDRFEEAAQLPFEEQDQAINRTL